MSAPHSDVVVVGIGADGWSGLTDLARAELAGATLIAGSARQLALLPDLPAQHHRWASPMMPDLFALLDAPPARPVHLLASGDPLMHGLGTTVMNRLGAHRVKVIPTVSSCSLAAARLGWDLSTTRVCSLLTDHPSTILRWVDHDQRLLILSRDASTPALVAAVLTEYDYGSSVMTVLGDLGGDRELIIAAPANSWGHTDAPALNIVAVHCQGPRRPLGFGLPDNSFESDGQLTKSAVRALTLSLLAPRAGQRLWDVGGGAGSIAIEWSRADKRCTAVVFESDPDRRDRIRRNAQAHGVIENLTVKGSAPEAFADTDVPDVVFIGGGICTPGVLEGCWDALGDGGRLVANAVTVESESVVLDRARRWGGDLRRVHIDQAAPLGSMTTWRPILPVTQYCVTKSVAPENDRGQTS
ncbi:precorrin-6y C5,15-methyltransferase (decarboxylating) subunit CbiE [Williamsia sp. CHRR-6]|uniref:precorrin-6y C5,15-methyltransferase (decarboxylating) subunit CbiE n=1 Tax=Williamsia sp. CHRR-6 TaxID=2835871 RepID=UPI001BDB16FE|nr:precorrin-6y C5,15-methyltransferase (decarboxylating) subunit CbiE [Williamsia sp. CHRR-6]MBT0568127.1 precorrin-6y C5,15-methyltransferase (decarboxylating) subunit CbiE [Williamsia sp. CHRR-6]